MAPRVNQNEQQSQALAVVKPMDIEAVFARNQAKLALVVPPGIKVDKLIRMGVSAIHKDPNLARCTPASLLLSMLQLCALGLEPNTPLQHAYLWGTNNKKKVKEDGRVVERWVMECQPLTGYRGLILLATESGAILDARGSVVYENDVRMVEEGLHRDLRHTPHLDDAPGKLVGAYCTYTLPSGKTDFQYWPLYVINRYVEKFGYQKGEGGRYMKATYRDHYHAMILKGVLRDASRFWPTRSDSLSKAFAMDKSGEEGGVDFGEERALIRNKAPELLDDLGDMGEPIDVMPEPEQPAQAEAVRV